MSEIEANGSVIQEMVEVDEGPGPASACRQRLGELAQQLMQAGQRKQALKAKIETMSRAQRAAQAEAAKARQQWSTKLRDSDGTLTRDIQKLRAAERSSLSLAEEYQAMEEETASELPCLELELAELASDCIKGRDDIAREVAEQAYEQLLAQAGESMAVALALFSKAENAGMVYRVTNDPDELASRFFGRINLEICRRPEDSAVSDQVAQKLALPPMDMTHVDMKLASSPSARSILRERLNRAVAE